MVKDKLKEVAIALVRVWKYYQRGETEGNLKKLAILASRACKKTTGKTKKPSREWAIRAKRLHKEALVYWKRRVKELAELRKRKEKLELEHRKREEER